jgi:uncharacterized cupin superfamily protein
MAAIRIVESGSVTWLTPREGQGGELREVDEPGDRAATLRLHPGSETELYLHQNVTPPDFVVDVHAHEADEIIYVIAGELHLGARVLTPGASVYIPADTLYGFHAGPSGLSFLNFRATRDNSHVSKEDFLAARAKARAQDSV